MNGVFIGGFRRHGKNQLSSFLQELIPNSKETSFAKPLKNQLANAFGVSYDLFDKDEFKDTVQPFLTLKSCKDSRYVEVAIEAIPKLCGYEVDLNTALVPRHLAQTWGTEYRRTSAGGHTDYWIEKIEEELNSEPNTFWIVPDMRLRNEFEFATRFNGLTVKVFRPAMAPTEEAISKMHRSETEHLSFPFDVTVNNTTLDELQASAVKISSLHQLV